MRERESEREFIWSARIILIYFLKKIQKIRREREFIWSGALFLSESLFLSSSRARALSLSLLRYKVNSLSLILFHSHFDRVLSHLDLSYDMHVSSSSYDIHAILLLI